MLPMTTSNRWSDNIRTAGAVLPRELVHGYGADSKLLKLTFYSEMGLVFGQQRLQDVLAQQVDRKPQSAL